MKKINLEDQSEARGYRAILISQQSQYLKNLVFNTSVNFDSVYTGTLGITPNGERNGVDIFVRFNSSNIKAPAGATHFRFVSAVSVISDFVYNASTKVYEPIDTDLNELNSIVYLPYQDLNTGGDITMNVNNTLVDAPEMSSDSSLIVSFGIEFYQKVGSNYYLFSSGNALKIHSIV
jgi:hypothetical protein